MALVIVKLKLQTTFVFFLIVVFCCPLTPSINKLLPIRLATGSVDGPSVLMEGVRGVLEHHNKQNNDKEENKGWFAILLLQLLQPYASTCGQIHKFDTVFIPNYIKTNILTDSS